MADIDALTAARDKAHARLDRLRRLNTALPNVHRAAEIDRAADALVTAEAALVRAIDDRDGLARRLAAITAANSTGGTVDPAGTRDPGRTRWIVTEHAAIQYVERWAPRKDPAACRDYLLRLTSNAVEIRRRGNGSVDYVSPDAPQILLIVNHDPDGTRAVVTVGDRPMGRVRL